MRSGFASPTNLAFTFFVISALALSCWFFISCSKIGPNEDLLSARLGDPNAPRKHSRFARANKKTGKVDILGTAL